jgi:hypothetical protein
MSDVQSTASPASPWKAAFSSRGFLLAAGVLAVAAVGLNSAARALEMHFKKQPVPLRVRLDDDKRGVPTQLGPWVSVQQTSSLNEDVRHTLGTDQFVFRTYLDSRAAGRDTVERLVRLGQEMEALDANDKAQAAQKAAKQNEFFSALRRVQAEHPEAVMSFNVTYYTGMVDTVAHVPERCMVADGCEPRNPQEVPIVAGQYPDGSPREIRVQVATFEDQTGHGRVARNVAYFFHCNGGYTPSSVGVRGKLQNLFERHGYYCKVELMTDEPVKSEARPGSAPQPASQKSLDAMKDLLAAALPEIERCLPDWNEVKGTTAVAAR